MFSRFDTIPECDRHPASHPASHVAVAITLNALAKASSLKNPEIYCTQQNTAGKIDTWQCVEYSMD